MLRKVTPAYPKPAQCARDRSFCAVHNRSVGHAQCAHMTVVQNLYNWCDRIGAICAHSVGAVKLYKNCTKRVNIRKSAYLQRARICDDLRLGDTVAYVLSHSLIQGLCESDRGMYKYCTVLHIVNVFNHLAHIVNVH